MVGIVLAADNHYRLSTAPSVAWDPTSLKANRSRVLALPNWIRSKIKLVRLRWSRCEGQIASLSPGYLLTFHMSKGLEENDTHIGEFKFRDERSILFAQIWVWVYLNRTWGKVAIQTWINLRLSSTTSLVFIKKTPRYQQCLLIWTSTAVSQLVTRWTTRKLHTQTL